jgi:hypothetical protein
MAMRNLSESISMAQLLFSIRANYLVILSSLLGSTMDALKTRPITEKSNKSAGITPLELSTHLLPKIQPKTRELWELEALSTLLART